MDDKYLSTETVTSSAQAFTTSWVDLGSEINTHGVKTMGVWLKLDINDTLNPRIRALGKLTKGATDEYELMIKSVNTSVVNIEGEYYEWNVDADSNDLLQIDLDYLVPFVQLQISCGTKGSTAGEIDACTVTKI